MRARRRGGRGRSRFRTRPARGPVTDPPARSGPRGPAAREGADGSAAPGAPRGRPIPRRVPEGAFVRERVVRLLPNDRPGAGRERAPELVRGEEELPWTEHGALGVVPALLVALGGVSPERLRLVAHAGKLDDERRLRQVVEQGAGAVEEERQPVLDAGRREPLAHVPVHRAGIGVALEAGSPGGPEPADGLRVEGELARGQQADRIGPVERALRLGVERADRLDLGIEEVDAVRPLGPRRKEIEERAPHRELAVLHHLADAPVASELEPAPRRLEVQPVADREHEGIAFHEPAGRDSAHEGGGGGDEDPVSGVGQRVQGGEALGDDVLVWRESVVGERLPVREEKRKARVPVRPGGGRPRLAGGGRDGGDLPWLVSVAGEEPDLGAERVRRRGVGSDDEGEAEELPSRRRDGERSARSPEPLPMCAVAGAAGKRGPQRAQWLHGSERAGDRTDCPPRILTRSGRPPPTGTSAERRRWAGTVVQPGVVGRFGTAPARMTTAAPPGRPARAAA